MNAPPALVRCERRGNQVVVSLHGELDVFNAPEVTAAIQAAVTQDALGAVLDLSDVGFLDSTAIRKLFELASTLVERRQSVHVVSPTGGTAARSMRLVGFAQAAPLHDSLDDALAHAERGTLSHD